MESDGSNPLISTQKSSDSGLQAVLHPLVLLTISDYITRHILREQPGPIVGALLGQQNGRDITIEHAFESATLSGPDGTTIIDEAWFAKRLDQMRTIHKDPQLDFVGWYTTLPKSGPDSSVLTIHNWLLTTHNESAILLAFHPDELVEQSVGGKLPLTIYESNYEVDEPKSSTDPSEDKEMKDSDTPLKLKFRELPYSVETGEAEMISMNFVAKGAGNATAIETRESKKPITKSIEGDAKGKRRAVESEPEDGTTTAENEEHVLSREDEELIAALTAKANAIKMLKSRISLLTTYLERLPPSYVAGNGNEQEMSGTDSEFTTPSDTILRSIQALVNRLGILVPTSTETFERERLSEANDVNLMSLLNSILQSVSEVRDVGKKYHVVETNKGRKGRDGDLGYSGSASFNIPGVGELLS